MNIPNLPTPIVVSRRHWYTEWVTKISRGAAFACLALFFAGCTTTPPSAPETLATVAGALQGARSTEDLITAQSAIPLPRPSAPLGVFIAKYLVEASTLRAALQGISSLEELLGTEEVQESEDFAILEQLGSMLQVEIQDMLNRSTDRAAAFDTYVGGLSALLERASARLTRLEQETDTLLAERRTKTRAASDVQRSLNEALREENYSQASQLQQQLLEAKRDVADVDGRVDQNRTITNLFEDLIKVGQQRLTAMQSNREILLAGLQVKEVPGIDNLGILQKPTSRFKGASEDGTYQYLFEDL